MKVNIVSNSKSVPPVLIVWQCGKFWLYFFLTLGLQISGSSTLVEGTTTTLTCQTDLNVTLIEWLDSDMMLLLNGSNSVLHLTNVTETGEYTCRITYPNGRGQNSTFTISSSDTVTVTISPPMNNNIAAAAAGVVITLGVVAVTVILAVVIFWK